MRFKAVLGGDFPVGDESKTWKIVAVRSRGREARFLAVIEPFEDKRMIKSATAGNPDTLRVELNDGRVQEIKIGNLQQGDGRNVAVEITETKNGSALRTETTSQNPQ